MFWSDKKSSWRLELSGDKELSGSDGLVEEEVDFFQTCCFWHTIYIKGFIKGHESIFLHTATLSNKKIYVCLLHQS